MFQDVGIRTKAPFRVVMVLASRFREPAVKFTIGITDVNDLGVILSDRFV